MKQESVCPVREHSSLLTRDMRRLLRRLDTITRSCKDCPLADDCEVAAQLEGALMEAAQEVLYELGGWNG